MIDEGEAGRAEACRRYQLKPQMLAQWKGEVLDKAPRVFQGDEQDYNARVRIAELEGIVGRLTLEMDIAASRRNSGGLDPQPGRRMKDGSGFERQPRIRPLIS